MPEMLFDTHAHYDDSHFGSESTRILESLSKSSVGLVMNVGCDIETSEFSSELSKKYPFVYAAVGVHPHYAESYDDRAEQRLISLCENKKVRAIGEIGLDYHYDYAPRELQQRVFERQLTLARELDLPAVIHDREAHEDVVSIIKKVNYPRGVFHCYSGSLETARILIDMGWYLSFNGVITFKNAVKSHEVIKNIPLDRIMIETDCPYLTPEPFRGERNDSRLVCYVAEKIAQIRDMTYDQVARITTENGKRFFGIE